MESINSKVFGNPFALHMPMPPWENPIWHKIHVPKMVACMYQIVNNFLPIRLKQRGMTIQLHASSVNNKMWTSNSYFSTVVSQTKSGNGVEID